MDRQQEYLRLLQERNRLKKMMNEKSEEEQLKEELEKGFSTHFRGAHAVKEKNAPTRFESKPTVKVHKSPNNIDLVKRLNPMMSDHVPPDTSRSRSTSRGGIKGAQGREQMNESNRENDQEQISITQSKFTVNSSVDTALLGQITAMSRDQKLALLQLLQADGTNEVIDNSTAGAPGSVESHRNEEDEEPLFERSFAHQPFEEGEAENLLLKTVKSELSGGDNLVHEDKHLLNEEEVVDAKQADHYVVWKKQIGDIPFHMRIRLSSTWNSSKNVFFQGIRLRSILESGDGECYYVDLLQQFANKLQLGLLTANPTHESVRLLNNLLGVGLNYRTALWKAPISLQNTVELSFDGNVPLDLFRLYTNQIFEPKDLLQTIELSIWNGFEENSDQGNVSINASAAKDVDIYVNDTCIWSGELPFESRKVETSHVMEQFSILNKKEAKPTLQLHPFSKKSTTESKKISLSAVERPVSSSVNNPRNSADLSFARKLFNSPGRSKPSTPNNKGIKPKGEGTVATDLDKPDWLQFTKENNSKTIVLTPKTKEGKLNDGSFRSPSRSLEREDGNPIKSPTKSINKAHRRRRTREVGSFDTEAGLTLSPSHRRTPKTVQDVTKDLEMNLRKSLEAVEHSEKFNLNRLETTVSRNPKRVSNDPEVNQIQQVRESLKTAERPLTMGRKVIFASDDEAPARDSNVEVVPSNDVEITRAMSRTQSGTDLRENRAAKIEQVNTKIANTLNDLADILAGLPKQPVTEEEVSFQETLEKKEPSRSRQATPRIIPAMNKQTNELPTGRVFRLEIFTTHGDMSYVGLNGLEFFDGEGNHIPMHQSDVVESILADPMDLSVLPGYADDPRKVNNLLDGVNNTKDDLHQWLAPHSRVVDDFLRKEVKGDDSNKQGHVNKSIATITLTFSKVQTLSMIKIYNFNKSRTHNQRGVRDIRIAFDGTVIFNG